MAMLLLPFVLGFLALATASDGDSPMSAARSMFWFSKLNAGSALESQDSKLFCSEAGLRCVDDGPIVPYFDYYCPPCLQTPPLSKPGHFFRRADLPSTAKLKLDLLTTSELPAARPYLPYNIARLLPVKTKNVPKLLLNLGISKGSNMSINIANAAELCTLSPLVGDNACVSSSKSMASFVQSKLGPRPSLFTTETPSTSPKSEAVSVTRVTKVAGARKPNVVCHALMSPFKLYQCHQLPQSEVYEVRLSSSTVKDFPAMAICHLDTSSWGSDHPAFKMLNMSPGESGICHWVRQPDLVWV